MAECGSTGRQRLRPWLIGQINGGRIPGLCWLDDERMKFKIPWKHGGKQDWNESDGQLFKEWAKHMGRYREGIDKPQYVKWKTNLRCALNKAKDIEYLERESCTQEDNPEPYRVYKFMPQIDGKKKGGYSGQCASTDAHACGSQERLYFPNQKQEAPVPKVVEDFNDEMSSQQGLPSDLNGINSSELRQLDDAGGQINVGSGDDGSLSSVVMTSVDGKLSSTKLKTNMDEEGLVESMNSITIDSVHLPQTADETDSTPGAISDPTTMLLVLQPDNNQELCDDLGVNQFQNQLCDIDPVQFNAAAVVPSTLPSILPDIYLQPVTQQSSAPHSETVAMSTTMPEAEDEYDCCGWEDMMMMTSDEF